MYRFDAQLVLEMILNFAQDPNEYEQYPLEVLYANPGNSENSLKPLGYHGAFAKTSFASARALS
jgi:hypothetical protein